MRERETYCVMRHFLNEPGNIEVMATGLTLDEAQAHCRDPETSSSTARSADGVARTNERGPWFDGYDRE